MEKSKFKLGKLKLIEPAGYDKFKYKLGKFKCFCGNEFITGIYRVSSGNTKSCGCYKKHILKTKNKTHGDCYSELFRKWAAMLTRCYNKNREDYKYYGGRGITVYDKWKNDFTIFKKWALKNGYKEGLTIDRKNNNLGYFPKNCRWVTHKIQMTNRGLQKTNTSGFEGVSFDKECKKWKAQISINNKRTRLGRFNTAEKASETYQKAKKERNEQYLKEFEQLKTKNNGTINKKH